MSLADDFATNGFCRVPGAIDAGAVAVLRDQLSRLFADPERQREGDITAHAQLGSIRFDVLNRWPEFQWLLTHTPIVQALREVLGPDYLVLPESAAHDSGFGDWHKDTTSQERAGHTFHWDPDFRIVQVALYFQDNGVWGGGIDVVPGSHRVPDRFLDATDRTWLDKVRTKAKAIGLVPRIKGESVPTRAGDAVIFDMRLDHKASWPQQRGAVPADQRKLALFFLASRNNAHAQRYMAYIRTREDYTYLRGYAYSASLRETCSKAGVHLAEPPVASA